MSNCSKKSHFFKLVCSIALIQMRNKSAGVEQASLQCFCPFTIVILAVTLDSF